MVVATVCAAEMASADLESSDLEYSDRDRQELLDGPQAWSRVRSLPALPERHIWTMRREAVVGCTLVCLLISLLVGLTQGVALAPGAAAPRPLIWAALALIYAEAAVALLCLLGLLFGNPGEVKRSPQSCFPMPERVADRLSQGESLDGLANLSSDGRTYCAPLQIDRHEQWLGLGLGLAVQYSHSNYIASVLLTLALTPTLAHTLVRRAMPRVAE